MRSGPAYWLSPNAYSFTESSPGVPGIINASGRQSAELVETQDLEVTGHQEQICSEPGLDADR